MSVGPLSGLRIIDLSMFVAGPFATATLGELGAEIIKVEPPGGDPVRRNGVGPEISGKSAQFHTYNHGKRSIELDLKSDEGRNTVLQLVGSSNVIFDNFRPGVMARLGLCHAELIATNPKLVGVSLSGFGSTGPWSKRAGYDLIVQALSGGLSLCGHPKTGPAHIPYHLGDTAGGLYAAIAILAAVREAETTGIGRAYEVSMLDAQLHLCSDEITASGTGEWPSNPHGAGHPALAPYAVFQTADDPIVIAAVGTEKFWLNLLDVLELPELASDIRFSNNRVRAQNVAALTVKLEAQLASRSAADWLTLFTKADVPSAPVLSVVDAVRSEHATARNLIPRISAGFGGTAQVPRIPIRLLGELRVADLKPAPDLDADSAFVQDLSANLGAFDE